MARDCCDKSRDDAPKRFKSVWVKTPVSTYSGEPNFLSASVYNQLINEMNANKSNIQKRNNTGQSRFDASTSAVVPGHISSGQKFSADNWNHICNQIAVLISDAKRILNNGFSAGAGALPASESEAYNLRYSAGEVVKSSKNLTRLINLVRRARINCACHVQEYKLCNHCSQHSCGREGCCQKSND